MIQLSVVYKKPTYVKPYVKVKINYANTNQKKAWVAILILGKEGIRTKKIRIKKECFMMTKASIQQGDIKKKPILFI